MAITNSDGGIVLTTRIEDAGLKKGMAKIISDQKTQLQSLIREYAKLLTNNKQNTDEAKKLKEQIDKLSKSIKENEGVLQSLENTSTGAFSRVGNALKSIAGYLGLAFSVTKIIQFSKESGQLATQTEASVQRLVDIYGDASDSVGDFIDQNARALGMSKSAAASFSSVYGNLFSAFADQETNAELTNRYLNMTAVVASKTGRTVEDVQERVRSGLLGNTEAIEDLGIFVNVKTIEMTDAFKRMASGKSWEQLDAYTQQQIRSMAILEQATAKYGAEVSDTSATTRNRYKAAYEDFKNSWGNIVNTVLLPILNVLTQVFDIATRGLNTISGYGKQILGNVEVQEDKSSETAENIEKQVENQKDLNKEMKKTIARFDDIQILSSGTDGGKGEEGGMLNEIFGGVVSSPAKEIKNTSAAVEHLMRIVAGAMMAIGVLLCMKGTWGWGIGLIIAGAATFSVTSVATIDEAADAGVGSVITSIMGILGDALVAVGIMLMIKGVWQWGIGFVIAGAAMIGVEYFSTTEFSEEPVVNMFAKIMGIAGTALAALGIILIVFGQIPWGIAMLSVGAVMLVAAVSMNNEAIVEAIQGPLGVILSIVGGALLVLGIILVCTGVALPLGIALIAAGAASLATTVVLNLDTIVGWVKGAWEAVKGFWNKYIAPVFTAKFWLDLAKTCGNGLITGFESAINGIIWLFEKMINFVVDGLNLFLRGVDSVISAVGNVFGQDWSVATIPYANLGRVSIPRLAQGAVIPPNREFLAVLGDQKQGTNIEAPLQTIVDAFNIALAQNGGASVGNTEVVLEIDGREFGRAVVEQGDRENRRIGTRLVVV